MTCDLVTPLRSAAVAALIAGLIIVVTDVVFSDAGRLKKETAMMATRATAVPAPSSADRAFAVTALYHG